MALRTNTPQAYQLDYDGSCRPGKTYFGQYTFSVGIFQWLPKSNGNGIKKSAVIKRVKGFTHSPQDVYDHAEEICQYLEEGLDD